MILTGRITALRGTKEGQRGDGSTWKMWQISFKKAGEKYEKKGTTFDDPTYYIGKNIDITVDMTEKDSGTPNPNIFGKNYINRSFILPNHVNKDGSLYSMQQPVGSVIPVPAGAIPTQTPRSITLKDLDDKLQPLFMRIKELENRIGIPASLPPEVGEDEGAPDPEPDTEQDPSIPF